MPKFTLPKDKINFRCTKCAACCSNKNLLITVTVHDLFKWIILGQKPDGIKNLIGFHIFNPEEQDIISKKLLTVPVLTEKGPAFMGMMRDSNNRCVMLTDENMCASYDVRPVACRQFPVGIFENPDSNLIDIGLSPLAARICEGVGKGKRIVNKDLIELAEDVKYVLDTDRLIIGKWNEKVNNGEVEASVDNFLSFLVEAPTLYQSELSALLISAQNLTSNERSSTSEMVRKSVRRRKDKYQDVKKKGKYRAK